jgi:hypothetical protein
MPLETITKEEFDTRLDQANALLRQEVLDTEARMRCLEDVIQRKEAFSQKLDKILLDIEQEAAEIALVEKQLRPRPVSRLAQPIKQVA